MNSGTFAQNYSAWPVRIGNDREAWRDARCDGSRNNNFTKELPDAQFRQEALSARGSDGPSKEGFRLA